jgi:hypothetical protein
MHMTKMHDIQEAEQRGRRRCQAPPRIVAVLVAVVSMAPAGPALAAKPSPLPTVTAIQPANGPDVGGTTVTITGTGFRGTKAVNFGSVSATSFTVNSATSITAISPRDTGTVDVTVTTAKGTSATSSADPFKYAPFVLEVSPRKGPAAGGTTVTVTGTGFTGATAVRFGERAATSFTVESDRTIKAVSPPYGGGSASVNVSVTTPAGTSEPEESSVLPGSYFRYGPTVTSTTPKSGPSEGGTSVVVVGTGFASVKGPDEFGGFVTGVKFGSASATSFTVNSESSITAVAPPGTGSVDVTVETYGGTSPTSAADLFSYL